MNWQDAVNRFWFDELRPDDWFNARPEIDAEIRARFGDLRAVLKRYPPDPGDLTATGHLAAVIVLDQFSRNLFRQSGEAHATDDLALSLARHAVDTGLDESLAPRLRQFLYMPFMHREDRDMQARSVALFEKLGIPDMLRHAERHKGIIDRFGRFPHRNAVLGRVSTEAELAFLRSAPPYP
jgi:uncharacterized protein (DUF924 family)